MNEFPKDKPVVVVKNSAHEDLFINDCEKLYDRSKISNDTFCGIDLEFNMDWKSKKRYISIIQIILIFNSNEYDDTNQKKPIYIFNPLKLSENNLDFFIKYVLCSKVTKIFHGSDSLDFPHIYADILMSDKKQFMKFLNSSIDTRFLCELTKRLKLRLDIKMQNENKCSLYYALINNDVIDKELFNILQKESDKINYNKPWIIANLTSQQIKYASYDVIYLYDLARSMVRNFGNVESNTTFDVDLDPISIVNRLYRFHMMYRLGLSKISEKCKNMSQHNVYQVDNIDQKIMDLKLISITFNNKQMDVYFEDVLSIDTIRKTIMNCLRVYKLDYAPDTEAMDNIISTSKTFNLLKGRNTIKHLINIIKEDNEKLQHNIKCNTIELLPT